MEGNTRPFHFKQFTIVQDKCIMKVSTDSVLLGAWANITSSKKILDIGTGTGILALMIAQRNSQAIIHAVEIDDLAVADATINIKNSNWSERITLFHKSIQDFIKIRLDVYDHIISNPPFFINSTLGPDKSRNAARHTLLLSFEEILKSCDLLLRKEGSLSIILPPNEAKEFLATAILFGFYCNRKTEIYPKENKSVERVLMELSKTQQVCVKDSIVIQKSDESNDYTEPYKELTKDFYKLF